MNYFHNIISIDQYDYQIINNIQVDNKFIKGFADFKPELLNDLIILQNWIDNIKNNSVIKEKKRAFKINKELKNEIKELKELKIKKDYFNHYYSYYQSQIKLGQEYLKKNNLDLNDKTIIKLKQELSYNEEKKIKFLKNKKLFNQIVKNNDQIKACINAYKTTLKINLNSNIFEIYENKRLNYFKKVNQLNLYQAAYNGIRIEKIGLEILKKIAKSMGKNFFVGEILSSHIWKIKNKYKKGMKQDIDGFIFTKNKNNIISVLKIFEFKSSHFGIISDIQKINKLLDYLINNQFEVRLKKSNDHVYRPTSNIKNNSIVLTNSSFDLNKFNSKNRFEYIAYLFGLKNKTKIINFNYLTLSQFNKIKLINNIKLVKKLIKNYIQNNYERIKLINKIGSHSGLIGIVITNNEVSPGS